MRIYITIIVSKMPKRSVKLIFALGNCVIIYIAKNIKPTIAPPLEADKLRAPNRIKAKDSLEHRRKYTMAGVKNKVALKYTLGANFS